MKEYFEKYRSRIVLMGLFVFLIHGAKLHSGIIGIDTEDLIHIQNDFYGGWLNTGRQGLCLLKWLMDSLNFNPYMAGLLTLICFGAAVCAFFLLWDQLAGDEGENRLSRSAAWAAGGLLLITHPVMTEQLYFTLQSAEIGIGLCSTVLALYLITRFREMGGIWRLGLGVLLLVLNFSIYQAFVVLFIFGTVSVLLTESIKNLRNDNDVTAGSLLKKMLPYIGVFFAAFVINAVITRLFFGDSEYLGTQILWGKYDIMDNFRAIVGHVLKVLTGWEAIHYHFSFGLLCIMLSIEILRLCAAHIRKTQKKGATVVVCFYLLALFVCPFLMTLVCGGTPVVRSQLVLPLATGFMAYLVCNLLSEGGAGHSQTTRRICVVFAAVVCIVGIWSQTDTTLRLYYTDEMRYEQDASLGRELITEIDRVRGNYTLPVAVVGSKQFSPNHACIIGEIIGKSFFDHDVEVEPVYYWSCRRMLGFLHTLGADYEQAAKEKFADIVAYSKEMPAWPAEGSVQLYDSMVIVKLSEAEE